MDADALAQQREIKSLYGISTHPSAGCNFWNIPKAGGTSVRAALLAADDPSLDLARDAADKDSPELSRQVHAVETCRFISPFEAKSNGLPNLAIVRHPEARVLSMFADLVLRRPQETSGGGAPFRAALAEARAAQTIDAFVEAICAFPDAQREVHFRSQTHALRRADIPRVEHLLFKLETLAQTLPVLNARLRRPLSVDHLNRTGIAVSLTPRARGRIRDAFTADYPLWFEAR